MRKLLLVPFVFLFLTLLSSTPIHAQIVETILENIGCLFDGNPTRPGGNCKQRVPYVHDDLDQYAIQCAVTPTAIVSGYTCGTPPPTTRVNNEDYIDSRLLMDFKDLELGGLGPDGGAWGTYSVDSLARIYPYNALGDKPLIVSSDTPREAFRSWWRVLPLNNQLAAKAEFFKRFEAQNPPIFDSRFPFIDPTNSSSSENIDVPSDSSWKYGINTAYGHRAAFFGSVTAGRPATFLLSIDSSLSDIQAYADLYKESTARIVRVTGIQPSTSSDKIKSFAASLSSVFTRDTDYTVFGNEVNDPNEYSCQDLFSCGSGYAQQFLDFNSALTGDIKSAAAPMNTSHATRDAALFLLGAKAAYQAADVTAHNTYHFSGGCAYLASRCSINSWQWEQQVTSTTGKPHIVTEYGLVPPEAKSLKEWVDWLVANPPSEDITTILTPNICSLNGGFTSAGWFFLVNPQTIYNLTGQLVDPDSCNSEYPSFKISELMSALPGCLRTHPLPKTCTDKSIEEAYYTLNPKTKAMYDAFLPFNFDNVRGYLALQYKEHESQGSSTDRAGVLAENLPYIQAVRDTLSNVAGGILNTLSPQWLNTNRILSDGSYSITYDENGALNYNRESNQVFNTFAERSRNNILGQNWATDSQCSQLPQENPSLSSPLTYPINLPAQNPYLDLEGTGSGELNQSVLVPVDIKEYFPRVTPSNTGSINCSYDYSASCSYNQEAGACPVLYAVERRDENTRNPEEPVRSSLGRSIISFTNPQMTDISRLVSEPTGSNNYSMYFQFLPKALSAMGFGFANTPIFAQEAKYSTDPGTEGVTKDAQAGATDKETAPVRRKGGQLEVDLCKLRNFWLRPAGLQAGSPKDCEDLETFAGAGTNTSIPGVTTGTQAGQLCVPLWVDATTADANAQNIVNNLRNQEDLWYRYYVGKSRALSNATQCSVPNLNIPGPVSSCQIKAHLFENSCPGGDCLSYVAFKARTTQCNGQTLNPYFAIAVALNESGGFISEQIDGSNSSANYQISGTHFGCDIGNQLGKYYNSISSKMDCFVNTIVSDCGKTEQEILSEYGYLGTGNLNSILNTLIDHTTGVCTQ